jgi:hypothetical protein
MLKSHQRLCGLGLCCVFALLVACGGPSTDSPRDETSTSAPGKPIIVVTEPEYDFGKVKQGIPIEHTFKIQNKGKGELIIDKARGS